MRILVLGAAGQTGSYVAEGLELDSRNSVFSASKRENPHFLPTNYVQIDSSLIKADMKKAICNLKPDWIVNMISLSSVFECEKNPEKSSQVNYVFVTELVQNILQCQEILGKKISLFQCSSSEMYSNFPPHTVINESSDLNPGTTYGIHKAKALEYLRNTKQDSNSFYYSSGILFNHESSRRSEKFVSMKIVQGARAISKDKSLNLELGDISVERDWSYAQDFAEGIISLLNQNAEGEFVFASGELHSIEEFCKLAFEFFGIENYKSHLKSNPAFFRSNNNNGLIGDSSKLRQAINWQPKVSFSELVRILSARMPTK